MVGELAYTPGFWSLLMRLLQRYVLFELLRVFALALSGLTVLLVVVGVVGEAAKSGLGPVQIMQILPYIVPSLLPFTIPATLLLTACVVYGRMSGDQEVTATKAAGINVSAILYPSFILGAFLSLATFVLTDQFIPWARGNIENIITLAMEDIFLDLLRANNQVTDTQKGVAVMVTRVEGKTLISPTFRYTPAGGNAVTIRAQEATVNFDLEEQEIILNLSGAYVETANQGTAWFEHDTRSFPLPMKIELPRPRNLTIHSIRKELGEVQTAYKDFDERRAAFVAMTLTQGKFSRYITPEFIGYKQKIDFLRDRYNRLHTEVHSRLALACSCFFFVLVGSPFSILQGKRQFLTNFFLCFVPILLLYYPLILLSMNLSKYGIVDAAWAMWSGNFILGCAGWSVLRKVLRH